MTGAPIVFDSKLLARHQARARRLAAPGQDFLLLRATDDLIDRIATVKRRFDKAVDIGTPTAGLVDALRASGQVGMVDQEALKADDTLSIAAGSIDLAISALALQWVNDLPGLLTQIRRALRPDGLFLAMLAGGDTLNELRTVLAEAESEIRGGAAPRVAPFADVKAIGALLQRTGFALPVTDVDRVVVRYGTIIDLMRDLRAMGATNVLVERDPRPLTRGIVVRAAELYAERFADADGRIRATFELVSLSGWAPHESQQKPLKPGSARMRLADAIEAANRDAAQGTPPVVKS